MERCYSYVARGWSISLQEGGLRGNAHNFWRLCLGAFITTPQRYPRLEKITCIYCLLRVDGVSDQRTSLLGG